MLSVTLCWEVNQQMIVSEITESELKILLNMLDREFIHNKNRQISLIKRFPSVFIVNNRKIFIVKEEKFIYGGFSLKTVAIEVDSVIFNFAFVGMVWVDETKRGIGIGRKLIYCAREIMEQINIDCGVLWTSKPDFYAKFGWQLSGVGVFGEISQHKDIFSITDRFERVSGNFHLLENIRKKNFSSWITRKIIDYNTLPIPAEQVFFASSEDNGYLMFGVAMGIAYIYEVVAEEKDWRGLLQKILNKYDRLYFNLSKEDPFFIWLKNNYLIEYQEQNNTMWLPLTEKGKSVIEKIKYIPYFDRI